MGSCEVRVQTLFHACRPCRLPHVILGPDSEPNLVSHMSSLRKSLYQCRQPKAAHAVRQVLECQ